MADAKYPKYQQLQKNLQEELKSGKFKVGDKFYTEREVMAKYKLSSVTVMHALAEMTKQGYFERKRKLGTFVKESSFIPGMSGNVMTEPLYVNTSDYLVNGVVSNPSYVFFEDIWRGITNNYPGIIRMEPMSTLLNMYARGEKFLAIQIFSGGNTRLPSAIVVTMVRDLQMRENTVSFESLSGVFEAVRYLSMSLKHTRIAYIGGNVLHHGDPLAGFRIACEVFGIPVDEQLVFPRARDAIDATHKLLALSSPPTAILTCNDVRAKEAIEIIKSKGLRVPEDISVIGFSDVHADTFDPPLTAVRAPLYDIGAAAVAMLMHKLRTGEDSPSKIFHCDLVVRKSTSVCKNFLP